MNEHAHTHAHTHTHTHTHTSKHKYVNINSANTSEYKKLSYCWETVRRESMPRIAEMDVKMTT